MKTLVYARVSSREQGDSGLGLEAQKSRCLEEIQRRDWSLSGIIEEVASAGKKRPELDRALRMMEVGQAEVLMVARIDRLYRSMAGFASVLDTAAKQDWQLVCLHPAVDMSDPYGRMMAQVAMSFAELERSLISIRSREARAAAVARGTVYTPPPYDDQATLRRIVRMHEKGSSYREIARFLTAAGVPTPSGRNGEWAFSTIRKLLNREKINGA